MSARQLPSSNPEKQSQLEIILELAAENLGDITPVTLELYYSRYPGAKQLFTEHGCGYTERLENEMVDSALYCLMIWFERPLEVEVIFSDAVPHHELLNIPAFYFAGLQEAVVDVIDMSIDKTDAESKALMSEIKKSLVGVIQGYSTRDLVRAKGQSNADAND